MFTYQQILEKIESAISQIKLPSSPNGLYKPITYTLSMGGKRIRPVFFLMANNLYKEDVSASILPAIGFEIFHNFTLLHDDLMDKADQRRGKLCVHKKWDENTAILSGDVMLVTAYQYIEKTPPKYLSSIVTLFSKTAAEICEGQQYDMEFETRNDVSQEEYIEMIRLKTAVLLGATLKAGAIMGDASEEDASYLYDFGINIGLAFQLKDDLLDVYGDEAHFGKKIGGDILSNKKTYLLINAMRHSTPENRALLTFWITKKEFQAAEKIKAVTSLYNEAHAKETCEDAMQKYYNQALNSLDRVAIKEEKKQLLKDIAQQLMNRIS